MPSALQGKLAGMNATAVLLLSLLGAKPAPSSDPLCTGRDPCRVEKVSDAGKDARGKPLQVKQLGLGFRNSEEWSQTAYQKHPATGRVAKKRGLDDCAASEWWLVQPPRPAQLLLSVCNDGYGAANIGEDKVRVSPQRFTHEQLGGSGTRWLIERTLELPSLRLLSTRDASFDAGRSVTDKGEPAEEGESWSWESLSGAVTRGSPSFCEPDEARLGARVLPFMPSVELDAAYLQGGWKTVALGRCGLTAKDTVLGTPDGESDASLKALLVAPDTLVVEVRDDVWTGPGAKWLSDDHVELWLGPEAPQELTGCGHPRAEALPVQWAIRMADGQVFPAYGSPKKPLAVERAEIPGKAGREGWRLKVKLPTPFQGLSVVYSDSDTGKKQELMLATSPLKFARPETLNPVRVVEPEAATCQVRGGALEPVPGPPPALSPDAAALRPQ